MTFVEYLRREKKRLGREPKVGFVGLGVSNRALLDRALGLVSPLTVRCDRHPTDCPTGIRTICGEGYLDGIDEDILFLSPSVRRDIPELSLAVARGTVLTSDCELFFDDAGDRLIFGVTGSDGKSTVTAMASEMLLGIAVGNIGLPYADIENYTGPAVAELSSFNLSYLKPKTARSVITNITPNHLNWHKSMAEYVAAKANILGSESVLSADCEIYRTLIGGGPHTLFSSELSPRELLGLKAEHLVYLNKGIIYYDGEQILPVSALANQTKHGVLNFMAATALTWGYADIEKIREVGAGFEGLSHRCRLVHESGGVRFFDSSIDTTPIRTATTLSGLGKRVRIILGGRGKHLSLEPLRKPLSEYASYIGVYGEMGEEICAFLDTDTTLSRIPRCCHYRFSDTLCELCRGLREGDTVLLSPACTAYGEFQSFNERGDYFISTVRAMFPRK